MCANSGEPRLDYGKISHASALRSPGASAIRPSLAPAYWPQSHDQPRPQSHERQGPHVPHATPPPGTSTGQTNNPAPMPVGPYALRGAISKAFKTWQMLLSDEVSPVILSDTDQALRMLDTTIAPLTKNQKTGSSKPKIAEGVGVALGDKEVQLLASRLTQAVDALAFSCTSGDKGKRNASVQDLQRQLVALKELSKRLQQQLVPVEPTKVEDNLNRDGFYTAVDAKAGANGSVQTLEPATVNGHGSTADGSATTPAFPATRIDRRGPEGTNQTANAVVRR